MAAPACDFGPRSVNVVGSDANPVVDNLFGQLREEQSTPRCLCPQPRVGVGCRLVASRDHGLMAGQLAALKAGGRTDVPVYDFVTHRRLADQATPTGPAEVVIVEGLHLFCTPAVSDLFDLKVFVDTPPDVRFIRRLIRDQAERGRSWDSVVAQYLTTVRPAHVRQIEPSRGEAEIVILDEAAAVRLTDPTSVDRLIAPILADPRVKFLIE